MATVINNPDSGDTGSGVGFAVGMVILLLIVVLFFAYGLPALRNNNNGGGADINVNLPENPTNGGSTTEPDTNPDTTPTPQPTP